jgi:DNA modification methylase
MEHLTEKPVEPAERAIQNSSRLGENVLDIFRCSGSTLIVAERTGRRAFPMKLDLLNADFIAQRSSSLDGALRRFCTQRI